jgi:hypothetical protein
VSFVARAHPATYVSLAIPDTRTSGATGRIGREVAVIGSGEGERLCRREHAQLVREMCIKL